MATAKRPPRLWVVVSILFAIPIVFLLLHTTIEAWNSATAYDVTCSDSEQCSFAYAVENNTTPGFASVTQNGDLLIGYKVPDDWDANVEQRITSSFCERDENHRCRFHPAADIQWVTLVEPNGTEHRLRVSRDF